MGRELGTAWKDTFFKAVESEPFAAELKSAGLEENLDGWTRALTGAVVATCENHAWLVAAKGRPLARLPQTQSEYLGIDAMAFEEHDASWLFPVAAVELENSRKAEIVEYSLWKLLNIRCRLRVLFCYQRSASAGPNLVRHLARRVVQSMAMPDRAKLAGETLVAVGSRNRTETFPYGFFKWWNLNINTGEFELF